MSPKTQQPQELTQSWAEAQKRLWAILEAQSAAVFDIFDRLAATPNAPEPARAQLHQVRELTKSWTETQRKLWEAMFDVLGQSSARTEHHVTTATPIELWQQLSRPVFEAQAAWLRQWSGLLAGAQPVQPPRQ